MAVFTISSINNNCDIEYKTSSLYEMMASIRHCYLNGKNNEGVFREFYRDNYALLDRFYGNFEYGAQLSECILGMSREHNLYNFLDYLETIRKEEFLYYILGRYISIEQIKLALKESNHPTDAIKREIQKNEGFINQEQLDFVQHFESYFSDLVSLWKNFYTNVFRYKEDYFKTKWDMSNQLLSDDIKVNEVDNVISKLLSGYEIPEQFPSKEIKKICFYPSIYVSPKFILIWGHGELTIVYDALRYIDENESNDDKGLKDKPGTFYTLEKIADVGKSLSEHGRLKILSLVANYPEIKSQEIANELNITPATVSRHLKMLEMNNLISHKKSQGFNVYSINYKEFEKYHESIRAFITII